MDSAMNETMKYCDQCGVKISSKAKFCSSCGCALDGSTKTTLDKTIKVEVTNATVEKVFKTVGKGVKATGAILDEGVKATGAILDEGVKATDEGIKATNRRLLFYLISLGKIIERIIIISIIGAILYGIGYVGFQLLE
jgi:hypothetical protein